MLACREAPVALRNSNINEHCEVNQVGKLWARGVGAVKHDHGCWLSLDTVRAQRIGSVRAKTCGEVERIPSGALVREQRFECISAYSLPVKYMLGSFGN